MLKVIWLMVFFHHPVLKMLKMYGLDGTVCNSGQKRKVLHIRNVQSCSGGSNQPSV